MFAETVSFNVALNLLFRWWWRAHLRSKAIKCFSFTLDASEQAVFAPGAIFSFFYKTFFRECDVIYRHFLSHLVSGKRGKYNRLFIIL